MGMQAIFSNLLHLPEHQERAGWAFQGVIRWNRENITTSFWKFWTKFSPFKFENSLKNYLWKLQSGNIQIRNMWYSESILVGDLPVNVCSHLPAFHSLIVLSAEPVNINPCSGNIFTAQTAAVWPYKRKYNIQASKDKLCFLKLQKLFTIYW